jgi:tetratricopeptide (TPR) repeat protein
MTKDASGNITSQGTGFLIEGAKVVTNHHVITGKSVFIDLGPVRIPASVNKSDVTNDIALLSSAAELAAQPLKMATREPNPGEIIFVIGNPRGLERSISSGIVSGIRQFGARRLLQISAPISPGSSGGPVLNSAGEVVGVAVGMLKDGQNLNFAVPASVIHALLSGKPTDIASAALCIQEIERLRQQQNQAGFSAAPDSEYQKLETSIKTLWQRTLEETGNDASLLDRIASDAQYENLNVAIAAAEKVLTVKVSTERQVQLARLLAYKAIWTKDEAEALNLHARAEKLVRSSLSGNRMPNADTLIILASALEHRAAYSEAAATFLKAFEIGQKANTLGAQLGGLRGLARVAFAEGRIADAQKWFQRLVDTGNAKAWDWGLHADRLASVKEWIQAGRAYRHAAMMSGDWENWCKAALYLYGEPGEEDQVLETARKCIETAAGQKDSETSMALSHRYIADILSDRGVYDQALKHARESIALDSTDPWAFFEQADALFYLRRYQECANSAKQAIRLSDGKFADMHFRLGSAYFEMEEWQSARQAFEKAAELNVQSSAAAYNVALCFARLSYYSDAAKWYEEVLRREPNHKDRQDILRRIEVFRK